MVFIYIPLQVARRSHVIENEFDFPLRNWSRMDASIQYYNFAILGATGQSNDGFSGVETCTYGSVSNTHPFQDWCHFSCTKRTCLTVRRLLNYCQNLFLKVNCCYLYTGKIAESHFSQPCVVSCPMENIFSHCQTNVYKRNDSICYQVKRVIFCMRYGATRNNVFLLIFQSN